MSYRDNKANAVTRPVRPTMTDQAQAKDTDINVIVSAFRVTGTAPGAAKPPMYGDYSELPTNLRDAIEQARGVAKLRRNLPETLRERTVEDLLKLTKADIEKILNPPAPPATTEEKK